MIQVELPTRTRGCCQTLVSQLSAKEIAEKSNILGLLSSPIRLEILHLIKNAKAPICACDLESCINVNQPTISHHLSKLKEAGFLVSSKKGIWNFYSINKDLDSLQEAIIAQV